MEYTERDLKMANQRQIISSGAMWERRFGYSRAVRVGNHIFVAGTTAVGEDGELVGSGDMEAQTRRIFEIIEKALNEAGASLQDVVRTRMFVTDITRYEEAVGVHGEIFADIRPAATLVEISALIEPQMLIEIEVDAVISD